MKKRIFLLATLIACLTISLIAMTSCSCSKQEEKKEESSSFVSEIKEAKVDPPAPKPTAPYYVLIIGNDTRVGTAGITEEAYADGSARSDTMMLARIDPATFQITLLTVPRDTQDWAFDRVGKINETYQEGGPERLIQHVEALCGIKVEYFLDASFVQFQNFVNNMGGLDINIPVAQNMTDVVTGNRISVPAGEQHVNGAQALIFARERKKYGDEGEAKRQTNDRYIVQCMISQILADPVTALQKSKDLIKDLNTNWPLDKLFEQVSLFIQNADKVHFISGTGPYTGGSLTPGDPDSMWVTYRNEALWKEIIDVVNEGGDPNTVLAAPSVL